jgi:hypothetical protein
MDSRILNLLERTMETRKDASRKTTPEPKKTNKDESVDLQVEQLEERIAPFRMT